MHNKDLLKYVTNKIQDFFYCYTMSISPGCRKVLWRLKCLFERKLGA